MHKRDQNFPSDTLDNMRELLENPDVLANPRTRTPSLSTR
jgi:hypothetical protein